MRRYLPVVLLLVALLCTPAVAGASKTFEKYGFSWTMPSGDWEFNPVSPSDVSNGFVAKAQCLAASIEVFVFTKPTEDLSLGEFVKEIRGRGGDGLGTVARTKVLDTTLSGIKGKVVIQKIKADGDVDGHFRKYAIVSNGKFYLLLMRTWHGAHETAKDEINGIRKGFRLLKGAGGPDKDESMTEVDGTPSRKATASEDDDIDEDESSEGDDDGGDDDDGDWPAGGPVKKGDTVCLPTHNFEWTLPKGEDSPWRWADKTENEKQKEGMFLAVVGRLERKKKEFEKDTPDYNRCQAVLYIQPTPPGHKPSTWVKSSRLQDDLRKDIFNGEADNSKTRTKEKVNFGNVKAAFLMMSGKRENTKASFLYFQKDLRGETYTLRVLVTGHTDRMRQFQQPLKRLLQGIHFPETKEAQRGPLNQIITDFAAKRGKNAGKEKKYSGPGYTFTKPAFMAEIQPGGNAKSMNRDFRHGFEGRTPDGEHYLYFEIRTYKLNEPNRPNPDPEKFVEKRGQDWLAGAGEGASIGGKKGDKLKFKNGRFGPAKGLTYKFTGNLEGTPFVEEGWVVKHKSTLLRITMQYGGQDAEKKLKKMAKTVKKAMKFKK